MLIPPTHRLTGSPLTLGLTDAELDRVTAGTVNIGDANSGAISVTGVISPLNYKTLSAQKGVAFTSTGGFDSEVTSLAVFEKMQAAGLVTIDPAATLTATAIGGFVPVNGNSFTMIENTTGTGTTGTFAGKPEGSSLTLGGASSFITYIGGTGSNDVIIGIDTAAPKVASTVPTAAATGVPTNSNLTINFNEKVNIGPGGITLTCGGVQTFAPTLPQNGVTSIVVDPTNLLPAGFVCTVTGVAANIKDLAGNQLDGDGNGTGGDNFTLTFTTACTDPTQVATNADSGAGSLRDSVLNACPGSTVTFAPTVTAVSLTSGQIVIDKNLIIQGPGANLLTVQNTAAPSADSRVFQVNGGVTATIRGLTITGGNPTDLGGGIYNLGTLTLDKSRVVGNTAVRGGGIRNDGDLTVTESLISNNTGTFASGGGGGIGNFGPALNVINSTISGNQTPNGNNNGGGIRSDNNSTVTISGSTITDNGAVGAASGGGLYRASGTVTVSDSIIAANRNNSTIPDVGGAFTSQGYNLIGNVGAATGFTGTADQVGGGVNPIINPQIAPLANNGGPTQTHALCTSAGAPHASCGALSPAIDKGKDSALTGFDQRGNGPNFVRPFDIGPIVNAFLGDGSDIGAYELNNTPPTITAAPTTRQAGSPSANSQVATVGDLETTVNTLTLAVNGSNTATVNGVTVTLTDSNGAAAGTNPTAAGAVFADVVAACGATTATFTLTVTDGGGLSTNATLTVTVNPNTAPVLTYNNPAAVVFGQSGITVSPATGPSDNGSVTSVQLQSAGTFTGNVSVNPNGTIAISNAGPVGTHTISIRATDNCGAQTTATFQITVNKVNTNTGVQISLNAPNYGSLLTATATMVAVAPGAGVPQGTVNFFDGVTPIFGCQNVPVTPLGAAVCSTSTLPAGVNKSISAQYSGNANFNPSTGAATQTIGKAPLNVLASSHTVTYGDAAPAVTSTITGFVLGETIANLGTQPACSTTYTQGASVSGSQYPTTCSGGVSGNYSFNYISGTVTVNKKGLTVTADPKTRAYGAANPALTATITGFVGADNAGNSTTGTAGLSTTATATSPVGSYPITATLGTLASTNYSFTNFVGSTLTVTAVQLTVTANNQTRVFGAPNPTLTFSITGFVNGEGVGALTGTPNISTPANATSAPGAYMIGVTPGTLASPNYTFATANGT